MDGKLCLWDTSRRRCDDLFGHEGSIVKVSKRHCARVSTLLGHPYAFDMLMLYSHSCIFGQHFAARYIWFLTRCVQVVADTVHNVALSLGYDGNVLLWSFPDSSSTSKRTGRTSAYTPAAVLTGHDCPVLECSYTGGRLASGGKDGGLILWACETGEIVARLLYSYRATLL